MIGVELSDIAVQAYFQALGVVPRQERHGRFVIWRHGATELWRGDLFDLTREDLRDVVGLYDCAALTALPADTRRRYVQHLGECLPACCEILLLTTESPEPGQADSAQAIDPEVAALYRSRYRVELLHGEARFKRDPQYPDEPEVLLEEKVYRLSPPAGSASR